MCAAQSRRLLQYGGWDVGDATRKGMKSTVNPQIPDRCPRKPPIGLEFRDGNDQAACNKASISNMA